MILEKRWHWFVLVLICVLFARASHGAITSAEFLAGGTFQYLSQPPQTYAPGEGASNNPLPSSNQTTYGSNYVWRLSPTGTGMYGYQWEYHTPTAAWRWSFKANVDFSGFTKLPDPTPTPTPTPTPGQGAIALDGFEEIKYEVWVDTDGDGEPDTVIKNGVIADGQTFNWEGGSQAWEIVAVEGKMDDGSKVPLNQTVASGVGTTPLVSPTPTPSVSYTPGPSINHVSVGGNGSVTSNPISTGNTTINGQPSTTYTYNNSSGGATTVIYSGTSATDGAKTQDIRLAAAQNSAENERILAALGELGEKIEGISSGTTPVPTATVGADPTENYQAAPGENPNEDGGEEVRVKGQYIFDELGNIAGTLKSGAGRAGMPTIGTSYGSTLAWTITLPFLGSTTVDLSPWDNIISAFRNFLKFVLALVAWLVCIKILRGTFV